MSSCVISPPKIYPIDVHLLRFTNNNAKAPDLYTVAKGIPYFPLQNRPFKNAHKHSTTHELNITSPIAVPSPLRAAGQNPRIAKTNAVRFTSRTVVAGMKIGDSLNVNLPTLASSSSLPFVEDCSFWVTSKTVSDIPKSFSTTLKAPNNHAVIAVILHILWLFHHARAERPAWKYSESVCRLYVMKMAIAINRAGSPTCNRKHSAMTCDLKVHYPKCILKKKVIQKLSLFENDEVCYLLLHLLIVYVLTLGKKREPEMIQ